MVHTRATTITVQLAAAGVASSQQGLVAACRGMPRVSEGEAPTCRQRGAVPGTPTRPLSLQMLAEADRPAGQGAAVVVAGRGVEQGFTGHSVKAPLHSFVSIASG